MFDNYDFDDQTKRVLSLKTPQEIIKFVQEENIENIDLKFIDLPGRWHHISIPKSNLSKDLFKKGVGYSGSSIPGFEKLGLGDMLLMLDPKTVLWDPFWDVSTLSFLGNQYLPKKAERFAFDPRFIAEKAENYLKSKGFAESCLMSPELEFYIFDRVEFSNTMNKIGYQIESSEAIWNSAGYKGESTGYVNRIKAGYHAGLPNDSLSDLRTAMVGTIEAANIPVKYHHHEIGCAGQVEIELLFNPLLKTADACLWCKYVIKNTALGWDQTATFLPKPLYGEAGSGMHIHIYLTKLDKNIFYNKKGYASLNQTALYFIGGILKHTPALMALTCASTNSYKRLVKGFESPEYLSFGSGKRSSAIRIPEYAQNPEDIRVEYRLVDATCNPYLAMAAILMAGLDGISKEINPSREGFGPFDDNSTEEPKWQIPETFEETLTALKNDHDFLTVDDVFPPEIIDLWINYKYREEIIPLRRRPHPYEFELYYDL